MSIMPCYPDERSVENELGGKWELFFEETRDETGAVGYEWDKDFDDNPLNLNGVLFVIKQDGVPSANAMNLFINGSDTYHRSISMNNTTSSAEGLVSWVGSKIENGLVNAFGKTRNTPAGTGQVYTGVNVIFADSINYLALSMTTVPSGTNIKVYVLRGV